MKIQSSPTNRQFRGMARGFSLFEMVIVMGIIAILVGGVVYSSKGLLGSAAIQTTRNNMQSVDQHLETYKMLGRRGYPTETQGLDALVNKPTSSPIPKDWNRTLPEIPQDGWNNPFRYKMPGSRDPNAPEIISAGPDGKFDTDDDLSSQD
ncbi:MAG: type II secretion system major pseudopilin GspG [Akkermansiaceae bacterium]